MPRLKYKKKGKRVNVWIPDSQMKTAVQIDNLSNFFQLALDQAADIMAWAILKDKDAEKYDTGRKIEDVKEEYNEKYPQNELTQKRNGTWHKNSQSERELW